MTPPTAWGIIGMAALAICITVLFTLLFMPNSYERQERWKSIAKEEEREYLRIAHEAQQRNRP